MCLAVGAFPPDRRTPLCDVHTLGSSDDLIWDAGGGLTELANRRASDPTPSNFLHVTVAAISHHSISLSQIYVQWSIFIYPFLLSKFGGNFWVCFRQTTMLKPPCSLFRQGAKHLYEEANHHVHGGS